MKKILIIFLLTISLSLFTLEGQALTQSKAIKSYENIVKDLGNNDIPIQEFIESVDMHNENYKSYDYVTKVYDFDTKSTISINSFYDNSTIFENTIIKENENEHISNVVIGNYDSRTVVNNVTTSPYNSIVKVFGYYSNGSIFGGTGFFVDDRTVVTAAHTFFEYSEEGDEVGPAVDRAAIAFGSNPLWQYNPEYDASRLIWTDYFQDNSTENDIAILLLDDSFNVNHGNMIPSHVSDNTILNRRMSVTGYPGSVGVTSNIQANGRMYTSSGFPNSVSTEIISYTIDTSRGQSGAPLHSGSYVYGVHGAGAVNASANYACRLNSNKVNWINTWKR